MKTASWSGSGKSLQGIGFWASEDARPVVSGPLSVDLAQGDGPQMADPYGGSTAACDVPQSVHATDNGPLTTDTGCEAIRSAW